MVIALIVLVLLATLGFVALEVADLNIISSANDREHKKAFLHADSGINVGIAAIQASSSIPVDNPDNTNKWKDSAIDACDNDSAQTPKWVGRDGQCVSCQDQNQNQTALILENATNPLATYVRVGTLLPTGYLPGYSNISAKGYEGLGEGGPDGQPTITEYLVRSRRYGERNSLAEIDAGWREIQF